MTMPWSRTEEALEEAHQLIDESAERLLGSIYSLDTSFFVHLIIEAALVSAAESAFSVLTQSQPGFDGQEQNDFILHWHRLDVDAVTRLEALIGFQHVLHFVVHPDNRTALFDLMQWPPDTGRLEQRLAAVYRGTIFESMDRAFDWSALDDIAESWRRDRAREEGPIHAVLLNSHLVRSTLGIPAVADTAMITSQVNYEIITSVQQGIFQDEMVRLWEGWAK